MGTCKRCQKPTFKNAQGKSEHDRRADPNAFGGRRADPNADADAKKGKAGAKGQKTEEREPERDHVLNRRLFGGKKDE